MDILNECITMKTNKEAVIKATSDLADERDCINALLKAVAQN